jgi:hypothetical protein
VELRLILVNTTTPGSISPHRRPKPQKKGKELQKKGSGGLKKKVEASEKGRSLEKR